jgi:PhnB protein
MQFNVYLYFNGQCEEAFKFYEKILGGKIEMMMPHEGSPAEKEVPSEWQKKILHARMTIGQSVLMASDAPPGRGSSQSGFSINIALKDVEQGKKYFDALSAGGNTIMPFGPTFWAKGFGMCQDRFGVPWMINCE